MAVLSALMKTPSPLTAPAAVRSVFIVKDSSYEALLKPLICDGSMPRKALDVLMLNLHDRDPAVRLKTLAAVARVENHPFAGEARDALAFYLGGSLPEAAGAIDSAVDDWLAGKTPATPQR